MQLFPVRILPILRCLPCLVVGMPVARAILPFMLDMPKARLAENEKPYFLLRLLAIHASGSGNL